jgi:hypothetical protein
VHTRFAPQGDGYAKVRRDDRGGKPGLTVSFKKAAGGQAGTVHLDLA